MASIRGGDKFEAKIAELAARLKNPGTLRVGFLENAKYPDGTPVAMIAAIQDYGAPKRNIPPRPFMRNAVAKHRGQWPKDLATLMKQNNYDATLSLRQLGEEIQGQIVQSILDTNSPPLKPATIKRKGSSKPLIDTALMIHSVNYDVKK